VADSVDPVGVVSALFRGARLLADRRRHQPLVRRLMAADWSWRDPAEQYLATYARIEAARSRNPSSGRTSRHAAGVPHQ
ncbi:MAG TPA: hypothetical protein VFT09_12060, partial [Ilumatobacteraceae bacterium]|nr:hypothetical protein [Ilumatobacteraceae bacterium]